MSESVIATGNVNVSVPSQGIRIGNVKEKGGKDGREKEGNGWSISKLMTVGKSGSRRNRLMVIINWF